MGSASEILKAIILGAVQGLTEFLPISSSVHLIIVPWLLGWEPFGLAFDVALHIGTLSAVFVYFYRDLREIILGTLRGLPDLAHGRFPNDPMGRIGVFIALASIPAHERDMRRKGIPMFGRGLVFQVDDDSIRVEPFNIPDHYHRICGIDFGWDHPFAAVWGAWDKDTDTFYVYDVYKEKNVTPPVHAFAINSRGKWIPVAWPHDGLNTEKGSGTSLAQLYRGHGVNLLFNKFSNPPADGQKEGEGGNKIWPGLIEMNQAMQAGKFKVFSHLTDWFMEKAAYHVDEEGKLVDRHDDIMAATRYAFQSRRFAVVKPDENEDRYKKRKQTHTSWRVA